ncbi:MAG: anti sigma factor C-terminal domain-containing protein [Coprobacillus sp.]
MKEKELDELLDLSESYQVDEQVNKKIKKGMIKNINIRIYKILIVIALIVSGLWIGIPTVQKYINYNPKNEKNISDNDNGNQEVDEYSSFKVLMQTYVGLNFPGIDYISSKEEDNGGGSYTIYAKFHEIGDWLGMDGTYNSVWKINQSKIDIEIEDNYILSRIAGEYKGLNGGDNTYYELTESKIQDIQDLPDSASLNVSISFNQNKNATQVIEFIKKYNTSFFSWIALKSIDEKAIAEGMSLHKTEGYDLTDEAKEKYPNLYLPNNDELTGDILLQNYLSTLKLLIDHKDFLKTMNSEYLECSASSLQKRYDDVKSSGLQCIGIKGWVKKKDLLQMIEKDGINCIGIADVKLSSLQK